MPSVCRQGSTRRIRDVDWNSGALTSPPVGGLLADPEQFLRVIPDGLDSIARIFGWRQLLGCKQMPWGHRALRPRPFGCTVARVLGKSNHRSLLSSPLLTSVPPTLPPVPTPSPPPVPHSLPQGTSNSPLTTPIPFPFFLLDPTTRLDPSSRYWFPLLRLPAPEHSYVHARLARPGV